MVTVISRPIGHKLTEQDLTGTVGTSSGDALITTGFAHGLVDGDYIYIQSNIESYNGFKYVDQTAYNEFKIKNSEDGAFIAFKQAAEVTYRISVLQHGWQCVHLPIVYELESTLSPTNQAEESYTPITVVSQSDNEGYTQLELSTGIALLERYNWLKIGTNVYRIVTVISPWSIVIDLQYDIANTFGVVINYYNNYCINVNIYAGIPDGHPWEEEQPLELAATLRLIPDENNRVKFSINEVLRGYINTRNNLTLDTLPNNIDFWTSFHIGYFESYDLSDGQEVETFEGAETLDDFVGYAVNAKLPFKSESISHLTAYLDFDTYLALWIVLQTRPIAIVGRFFDMSFINRHEGTPADPGFTHVPMTGIASWATFDNSLATMVWTYDIANPFLTVTAPIAPGEVSDIYFSTVLSVFETGRTYTYQVIFLPDVDLPSLSEDVDFEFLIMDVGFNVLYTEVQSVLAINSPLPIGSVFSFVAPATAERVGFRFRYPNGASDDGLITIVSIADTTVDIPPSSGTAVDIDIIQNGALIQTIENPGLGVIRVPLEFAAAGTYCIKAQTGGEDITEEICVEVFEECDDTLIDGDGERRLLEDGGFRLLE